MYHKGRCTINKVIASFASFLMLFADVNCTYANAEGTNTVGNVQISAEEVRAFKIGAIFAAAAGLCAVGAYFPVREVKHAIDYYSAHNKRYDDFVKSFPNYMVDKKSGTFAKQDGVLWDWVACLGYVMKSQKKGMKLTQKDIVKKLFDKCAFFAHNRKESLPINGYYDSGLLESVNKLADENDMVFVRELNGLGMMPKVKEIKDRVTNFYKDNGKVPFVINDSYFYNEKPFVHFVIISEIDGKDIITVKDPVVGLSRKQPLDVFCQGYIYDNGYAKLPSLDMYTLKVKKDKQ